jgi:hypothetical protein
MGGACSTHAELRNAYKILVGKPEGKRPLERLRWEDNIKVDLKEIVCENDDSFGSGEGPVAGSCECGNDPSGSRKVEKILD